MMRAISLWQPWASAMARRYQPRKWFETRSWEIEPTRDIAIHAAQRWTGEQLYLAGTWPFRDIVPIAPTLATLVKDGPAAVGVPAGAVVCVVDFTRIHRTEALVEQWRSYEDGAAEAAREELAMGDYTPGRFAWEARNLRILREPVALRGRQGLWTLTASEERRVHAQLEEAIS